jgi:Flp pilus assembly protein TadG
VKAGVVCASQRFMNRLTREDGGVSAIEFAIASPLVFILVLGTVELAVDMSIDATVQMAAQSASRVGLTVTPPSSGTREAQAKSIVLSVLGGWLKMPRTTVTVTELDYGNYSNLGTSSYSAGAGAYGDVVSYNIVLTTPGVSGIPQLFGVPMLTFQRNFIVQNEK